MGEYTAAHLAGVFSLEDALQLVVRRGELFECLPEGGMLSVPLSEAELLPLLDDGLDVAAINKPSLCVASGATAAIDALADRLAAKGVDSTRLHIPVTAHSRLVEPTLEEFGRVTCRSGSAPAGVFSASATVRYTTRSRWPHGRDPAGATLILSTDS